MERVHRRETQRIHGLSQNEDLSQAVHNLQSAAACARTKGLEKDLDQVMVHALLLQSRLVARGDVEGLQAAARVLGEAGISRPTVPAVDRAIQASHERLTRFARELVSTAHGDPDATLRAHLASSTLDPEYKTAFPKVTRALINHADTAGGCFTLVNHQGLPSGTAIISLKRDGKDVALSGDPPTFGASAEKPRLVRQCTSSSLRNEDVVQVHVSGQLAWQQKLVVSPGDEIRGAFTRGFVERDVSTQCQQATDHAARMACNVQAARGKP